MNCSMVAKIWLLVLRLLFFRLVVSLKAVHALAKQSIKDWSCDGLCAATAASFVNIVSLIVVFFTFVAAFKREELNSLCMQVYTFFRYAKSLFEKQPKENPKECWC